MSRGRFLAAYALPTTLLLALAVAPLVAGGRTLFLRDVFNTHLAMKHAQAEAMAAGVLPLVDPARAGGQPLAGNPNAVAFYPTNVLYLAAPFLWAFNAHFWLHWLLAPWAFYALARAFGLGRPAAWAAATCWALSGYYASQLSFYNLLPGATLAPALAAAVLAATGAQTPRRRRWAAAAAGLLWAMVATGGDPLTAVLALALAGGALLATGSWRSSSAADGGPPAGVGWRVGRRWLPPALGLAAGSLLALPQAVEFLRILPGSFRGAYGFSPLARTVASFDPRQALEWLLPFAFGRPDRIAAGSFWGHAVYTDTPPYFFTLYPGLLALGLVAVAGRPRSPAARWAWGAIGCGLFFALGRFNPAAGWLFGLGAAESLRYPIKFWLPVAAGAALLCGIGFERAFAGGGDDRPRRRLARLLAALAGGFALAWLALSFLPGAAEAALRPAIPASFPDAFVANERLRWAGLAMFSAAVAGALAGCAALGRRRPAVAGALALALHGAAQLFFLAPARPTDDTAAYREPSPAAAELLALVPPDAVVVHGAFARLFGSSTLYAGRYPEPTLAWLERRAFAELYPMAGVLAGRRYALDVSPEGLDGLTTRLAAAAVEQGSDRERVRLLAAWGVDRLLLDRPLAAEALAGGELLAARPSFGHTIHLYAVRGAAPEVAFATRVLRASDPGAAVDRLIAPGFDPRTAAVLPDRGDRPGDAIEASETGAATPVPVELRKLGRERLEVEVDAPTAGALVWRRAWLPLYRAEVDGRPVSTEIANLHHLAVELPAGRHRVSVWVDRTPLRWAGWGAAVGAAILAALALVGVRRPRPVSMD